MSSPDPTRRPGVYQGPGDAEPQPFYPYVLVEDEMAAIGRLARLGIALGGLLVVTALLLVLAAIQLSQRPDTPTTVPAPVTVPAAGSAGPTYIPVPAGKP